VLAARIPDSVDNMKTTSLRETHVKFTIKARCLLTLFHVLNELTKSRGDCVCYFTRQGFWTLNHFSNLGQRLSFLLTLEPQG
jgi:hypothetical protein